MLISRQIASRLQAFLPFSANCGNRKVKTLIGILSYFSLLIFSSASYLNENLHTTGSTTSVDPMVAFLTWECDALKAIPNQKNELTYLQIFKFQKP
jgi:hypothetical protein